MKTSKTAFIVCIGMTTVLAILFLIWWVNGRDQTLFYAAMALVVVSVFLPYFFKKRGRDRF